MGGCCGIGHSASKSRVNDQKGDIQGPKKPNSRSFRFSVLLNHDTREKNDSDKICSSNRKESAPPIGSSAHKAERVKLEQDNNSSPCSKVRYSSPLEIDSLIAFRHPTWHRATKAVDEDSIDTFQVSYSTITSPDIDDIPTVNVSQPTQSAAMTDASLQQQPPRHPHTVSDLTSECDYTHSLDQMPLHRHRMNVPHREPERHTVNVEANMQQQLVGLISSTRHLFLAHYYRKRTMLTRSLVLKHIELMITILEKEESLQRNHIETMCNMEVTTLANQTPSLTQTSCAGEGIRQQLPLVKSRNTSQYAVFESISADFSSASFSSEESVEPRNGNSQVPRLERANTAPSGFPSLGNTSISSGSTADVGYYTKDKGIRCMAAALPLRFREIKQAKSFGCYDGRASQQELSSNSQAISVLSSVRTLGC